MDMIHIREGSRYDGYFEKVAQRYVIYAMENCGFSSEDIRRVVGELHYIFDFKTLEEAKHHYENGSY